MAQCKTQGRHTIPVDDRIGIIDDMIQASKDAGYSIETALAAALQSCKPCQVRHRRTARTNLEATAIVARVWLTCWAHDFAHSEIPELPATAAEMGGDLIVSYVRPLTREFLTNCPTVAAAPTPGMRIATFALSDIRKAITETGENAQKTCASVWDDALDGIIGYLVDPTGTRKKD